MQTRDQTEKRDETESITHQCRVSPLRILLLHLSLALFSLMQGAPQLLAEEDKDREEQDGKHQGEHESQTPVARFVDVRSEPPSHDGVSNLGHPRLLSWRECRTSWSGTPFSKGAVEVVESEA